MMAQIELAPPELAARVKEALMYPLAGRPEARVRCLEELQEFTESLDLDQRLLGVRVKLSVDGEPDLTLSEIAATCKIVDAMTFTEAEFRSGLDSIRSKRMQFEVDDQVKLQGLGTRADLNGKRGIILSFQHRSGRWTVRLSDGKSVKVRSANLLPSCACRGT